MKKTYISPRTRVLLIQSGSDLAREQMLSSSHRIMNVKVDIMQEVNADCSLTREDTGLSHDSDAWGDW